MIIFNQAPGLDKDLIVFIKIVLDNSEIRICNQLKNNTSITLSEKVWSAEIANPDSITGFGTGVDISKGGGTVSPMSFNFTIQRYQTNPAVDGFFNEFYPNSSFTYLIGRIVKVYVGWEGITTESQLTFIASFVIEDYQYAMNEITISCVEDSELDNILLPLNKIQKEKDDGISYFTDTLADNYGKPLYLLYGSFPIVNSYLANYGYAVNFINGAANTTTEETTQGILSMPLPPAICIDSIKRSFLVAGHKIRQFNIMTNGYIPNKYILFRYYSQAKTYGQQTSAATDDLTPINLLNGSLLEVGGLNDVQVRLHCLPSSMKYWETGAQSEVKDVRLLYDKIRYPNGTDVISMTASALGYELPISDIISNIGEIKTVACGIKRGTASTATSRCAVANERKDGRDNNFLLFSPIDGTSIYVTKGAIVKLPGNKFYGSVHLSNENDGTSTTVMEDIRLIIFAIASGWGYDYATQHIFEKKKVIDIESSTLNIIGTVLAITAAIAFPPSAGLTLAVLASAAGIGGAIGAVAGIANDLIAPDSNIDRQIKSASGNNSGFTNANIAADGRMFDFNWMRADKGFVTDDLIENPAYIIESLLRDEVYTERGLTILSIVNSTTFNLDKLELTIVNSYQNAIITNFSKNQSDYISTSNGLQIHTGGVHTNWAVNDFIMISNIQADNYINTTSFDNIGHKTTGLRKDYKLAYSLDSFKKLKDIISKICYETFCILTQSQGKYGLYSTERKDRIDLDIWTTPLKDLTNGMELASATLTSVGGIYTEYIIHYSFDYGSKQYLKTYKVNKNGFISTRNIGGNDTTNTTSVDLDLEQVLCREAEKNYKIKRVWEYNTEWLYDDATTLAFFKEMIRFTTQQKVLLTWVGDFETYGKYEIGDQVVVSNNRILPAYRANNGIYIIYSKTYSFRKGSSSVIFKLYELIQPLFKVFTLALLSNVNINLGKVFAPLTLSSSTTNENIQITPTEYNLQITNNISYIECPKLDIILSSLTSSVSQKTGPTFDSITLSSLTSSVSKKVGPTFDTITLNGLTSLVRGQIPVASDFTLNGLTSLVIGQIPVASDFTLNGLTSLVIAAIQV